MENVRQRSLDQFPARNALDGFRQRWRKTVQLILDQNSFEGLKGGRTNHAFINIRERLDAFSLEQIFCFACHVILISFNNSSSKDGCMLEKEIKNMQLKTFQSKC